MKKWSEKRRGGENRRITKYSTPQERKARLEEQKRCLKCLQQSHSTEQCPRAFSCRNCGSLDHHFIICFKVNAHNQPINQSIQIRQTRNLKQTEQNPRQNSFQNRQNNNFKPKLTGANATTLNNPKPVTTLSVINEESEEKDLECH